jgi:hypothetical protein
MLSALQRHGWLFGLDLLWLRVSDKAETVLGEKLASLPNRGISDSGLHSDTWHRLLGKILKALDIQLI